MLPGSGSWGAGEAAWRPVAAMHDPCGFAALLHCDFDCTDAPLHAGKLPRGAKPVCEATEKRSPRTKRESSQAVSACELERAGRLLGPRRLPRKIGQL